MVGGWVLMAVGHSLSHMEIYDPNVQECDATMMQ